MSDAEKSSNGVRQGIGSLELGLKVLDRIAESSHPVSLKQLSDALEMSPSRIYKYLVSLMRTGYIVQDMQNSYRLGQTCLTLGVSALKRIGPIQQTFAALDQLNAEQDVTCSVTIWNGNAPLVIKWLDASIPVAVNVRLGIELSPFFSVSGRLFLANLPDRRRQELIENFYRHPPALPRHRGEPMQKDAFYDHLAQVKEQNYCCFFGDYLPDINVMGSAVFDINGNISSVISLMGIAGDIDVELGSRHHTALMECTGRTTDIICGRRRG